MGVITSFSGENFFLSNFYPRSFWYVHPEYGRVFAPTAEHHFQAAKATIAADWAYVLTGRKASEAKRRGRSIEKRSDWEEVREDFMLNILRAKFSDPILRAKLIETSDHYLLEGNTWGDKIWGAVADPTAKTGWRGMNKLGLILMKIRSECREAL